MERGTPPRVQPAEEVLNIELVPGDLGNTTQIGSQINDATQKDVIHSLRHNIDIFAWTLQGLEGIDPKVITHHLNIDPQVKPVKQKKRHYGLEKDKIILSEIDKLMAASILKKYNFQNGYPMWSWYPNPKGNEECASISRTSTRRALRTFILYLESIS
ncbi:UNVERIFIED_CONTAM: hypothetical protein Sradi_1524900 [Sesamum radiatum]|uniref:Uncharacterized protein n=1 Tax=Sesamum radiatum TaxID=300843 RepID=A0AAW2U8K3_SESRA